MMTQELRSLPRGRRHCVPNWWLQPDPVLPIAGIWGVNQGMEDLHPSVPFSFKAKQIQNIETRIEEQNAK